VAQGICPVCGWPKYLHSKIPGVSSKRLPKDKAQPVRVCALELVDLAGQDDEIPVRRADVETYRMRAAAYAEERALRFEE
jgi:hypothetical protein